jgi:predicted ATPase
MITKIELTNFKSHAHTVLEPGRVTALVGPNGCGKTSLLRAVQYLSDLLRSTIDPPGTPLEFLRQRGDPTNLIRSGLHSLALAACGANDREQFKWEVEVALDKQALEQPVISWKSNGGSHTAKLKNEHLYEGEHPKEIASKFDEPFYYKGISKYLWKPSYSEILPPRISTDGEGLASTIANLMTSAPEIFQELEKELIAIVPIVKRVRTRRAKVTLHERKIFTVNDTRVPYDEARDVTGDELIFDTISTAQIPAREMSEGTLLTLGLLSLLYCSPTTAQLFLLDDIEAGLHPLAQRQLMQTLKEFAEKQNRQIILTSHSPYIIDELAAKDIWVMSQDNEGITHTKRLSDHPDAERALSVLTTGEFASAEGEEWVIEENSPTETVNA